MNNQSKWYVVDTNSKLKIGPFDTELRAYTKLTQLSDDDDDSTSEYKIVEEIVCL